MTSAISVPSTITTVNGAGHTISATNPDTGVYTGAVLTNATSGQTMNIKNLTITGPTAGFSFPLPQPSCNSPFPGLFGIFFNDASGSVNNVKVLNIFQTYTGPGSPACIVGHAIRADGVTAQRTVNITNTQVSNYQRGGMFASGRVTMNVSASTIGPGSSVPFSIAQNAVQWAKVSTNSNPAVGASGSMTGSTIVGTSFVSTHPIVDPASDASTAVLLYGASNVTVDHNTITGGSDVGVWVSGASTNSTISFNAINRPNPPIPDSYGIGAEVDGDSAASTRLICNTFSGWRQDIEGAVQGLCITPPTLPDGTECHAYSAQLTASGTAPHTWSVVSGRLPLDLTLAPSGAITGTPTEVGTFNFTVQVTDATGLTATQAEAITVAPDCGAEIDKSADSPTVMAGGLAGYRITVTNRSSVTRQNWWACDRIPRGMTFVRATLRVRRLGRLRCVVIRRLRPHQRVGFHITLRVASNAPDTTTNIAEVIPGPPPGTGGGIPPAPPSQMPSAKADAKVKVRHPASTAPVAPPPVTG
ncbi:MAG TPA: putative Ig domain-containing protein [Solirubrobacteraceae bacterium]